MSDLLLDKETHNIVVSSGDMELASGAALIAQNVKQRLLMLFAEHFLDTTQGVPYKEQILRKNPDVQIASSILKERILGTTGVKQLVSFTWALDPAVRKCTITFKALTDEGALISQTVEV